MCTHDSGNGGAEKGTHWTSRSMSCVCWWHVDWEGGQGTEERRMAELWTCSDKALGTLPVGKPAGKIPLWNLENWAPVGIGIDPLDLLEKKLFFSPRVDARGSQSRCLPLLYPWIWCSVQDTTRKITGCNHACSLVIYQSFGCPTPKGAFA